MSAHACLSRYVCVCVCLCATDFATLLLHYGGKPWCSRQDAAAGRPLLSQP